MCASATTFLMSVRHVLDTIAVAAAGVFGTRRMPIRPLLGAMPASALAGRQAHVEIDLLPHLLSPCVSADVLRRGSPSGDQPRWQRCNSDQGLPLTSSIASAA
jgi:hypothetical protein